MDKRKKIILYNPKAVFFDMPLALLAIGSVIDAEKYEVIIIDGRMEDNAAGLIEQHLRNDVVEVRTVSYVEDFLFLLRQQINRCYG